LLMIGGLLIGSAAATSWFFRISKAAILTH
jgi:hypothetical protein